MHPAPLNGHPKCTLIESYGGEVFVVRPGFHRSFGESPSGKNLRDAQKFIDDQGWEINIEIIKGSPILRRMQE